MKNVVLMIILITVTAVTESYFLWKRQLKKEMAFSLLIWVVAAVYAALVVSPLGNQFSFARLLIGTMNFIYGLF